MKALLVVGVLGLVILGFFGMYVGARNQMVAKNETVKAAWSQVDVVLQRRADLILLSAGNPRDRIAANQQLDGSLGRLLAVVENYPQLRSNENFLRLQDELAGTENRIAVERKRYNDAIQDYNVFISVFPNNVYAGWAGFKRNDAYFAATEGSRQVPKVDFSPTLPQTAPQAAPTH